MADHFQISMMTPSKGRDYVTISISIFVKCRNCWVFANPVTYALVNRFSYFLGVVSFNKPSLVAKNHGKLHYIMMMK